MSSPVTRLNTECLDADPHVVSGRSESSGEGESDAFGGAGYRTCVRSYVMRHMTRDRPQWLN
jgi:hypothetical protein